MHYVNIIRMTKFTEMRWEVNVARMEKEENFI
jgi:hypothetical protein